MASEILGERGRSRQSTIGNGAIPPMTTDALKYGEAFAVATARWNERGGWTRRRIVTHGGEHGGFRLRVRQLRFG